MSINLSQVVHLAFMISFICFAVESVNHHKPIARRASYFDIASLPVERITRAVRPDAGQRSALKELPDATGDCLTFEGSFGSLSPRCAHRLEDQCRVTPHGTKPTV